MWFDQEVQLSIATPREPSRAPGNQAPAKPLHARAAQVTGDVLCLMDLDETTAALLGSTDHSAVTTMGILDGLKVMGLGAARFNSGHMRGDREAMFDGVARMGLGAGSMLPGLLGNGFVGATGLYLAVQGVRHHDTAQTIAGALQIGVAASFAAIGAGAGLPAQAAILALQVGKIGTYAYHSKKHAEAVAAGDVDRLGRFMHGILHRNDHWGKVDEEGRGKVWTDSPSGHYSNFSNLGLVSQPISLAGTRKPELAFDLRHDLEPEADFLHVEARPKGGQWTAVERLTGRSDWREHRLDLSSFQDQTVELRFRVQTDASQTGEGCFLDRVRVEAPDRTVLVPLKPQRGDLEE